MVKRHGSTIVAVLALLFIGLPGAYAVPTLVLFDGTTTITVVDGGLGDVNPNVGAVTFIGAIGIWTTNVDTGLTKPAIPGSTAANPAMDLTFTNVSSSGSGTLTIRWSDDNWGPLNPSYFFRATWGTTVAMFGSGSGFYNTYQGPANAIPATGPLTSVLMPNGPSSGIATATPNVFGFPYSLTQELVITHTSAASSTGDVTLDAVPEPSALLLLGSGLSVLGLLRLRKRT